MVIHPQLGLSGKSVTIHHPTLPTPIETWEDDAAVAITTPGGTLPHALGLIPFRSDPAHGGHPVLRTPISEPAFQPGSLKAAAGVVLLEPDGRVWAVAPTNGFGGYALTFPKGRVEDGLSLQLTAVKEAYEETGLAVALLAHLADAPRSTTFTRYYLAQRIGGSPADMGWESQAVHLIPAAQLAKQLTHPNDQPILHALRAVLQTPVHKSAILDASGTARRLGYAIEGFLLTHGEGPTRLRASEAVLSALSEELTPQGLATLQRRLKIEALPDHALILLNEDGLRFDYDRDEVHGVSASCLSHRLGWIWLWGLEA